MWRRSTTPCAARMPRAIGRSNEAPAFLTSAGARLTVTRWAGNSNPEFRIALLTRSRLSRTLASGRPTIVNAGKPNATSTSTWTGQASTPKTAAVRSLASTPWPVQDAARFDTGLFSQAFGASGPKRPRILPRAWVQRCAGNAAIRAGQHLHEIGVDADRM